MMILQVIDEDLLLEGSRVDSKAGKVGKAGDFIDLAPRTTTLELSFKNIGRIENLNGFNNVTKLCLDNNRITNIQNLEHLTKIRWLDLSFNKICKIEGLSTLVELQDLSLFGNTINTIEGLDSCVKLQCLSLGNNSFKTLDQVVRLRGLSELRMLTLSGNPVCKEQDYKATALAYLKYLKYLDYTLVDQVEVADARNAFYEQLEELEESEGVIEGKRVFDKAASDGLRLLEEAGILFADTLFDDMFSEDAEIARLKSLPHVKDKVDAFRFEFREDSKAFTREAMEIYRARKSEVSRFESAIKRVRATDDEASVALVEGFHHALKNDLADALAHSSDGPATDSSSTRAVTISRLMVELDGACDELMSTEVRQVEKFEAMLDDFENKLGELKLRSLDLQQQFFRKVEDHEEQFTKIVKDTITELIDKHSRDELMEDYLEDDAIALVLDKDVCLGFVTTSHESHVGKILKREEDARVAESKTYQEEVARYVREERARNRDRVLQIFDFARANRTALEQKLSAEDEEGVEDELNM